MNTVLCVSSFRALDSNAALNSAHHTTTHNKVQLVCYHRINAVLSILAFPQVLLQEGAGDLAEGLCVGREEDISCGSWFLRPKDAGLHRQVHSVMEMQAGIGDRGGFRSAQIQGGRQGLGVAVGISRVG